MSQLNNNWYARKNVFVTGHTGFKGAWLIAWLRAAGALVTGYALPPRSDRPNLFQLAGLGSEIDCVFGDVCDRSTLDAALRASQPELVFHLAAQSLVRPSYLDPVETYRTNVLGTVHLLDAVRAVPSVRAVVIVTSDKCYENRGTDHLYAEGEPMGGHDPYSSSKGCAELVTAAFRRSFFREGSPSIASARAGNAIGGGDWALDRIVPDLVAAAMDGSVALVRNPSAVRPWQFVLEPLRGYLMLGRALVTSGQEFASGWNFGPREEDGASVGELADRVRQAWGNLAVRHELQANTPHEASVLRLDSTKAGQLLGWRPALSLSRAIELTVEGYRRFQRPGPDVLPSMNAMLRSYWDDVAAAEA
jgi:CDP-glucose 4,6-dehydratase